MLHQGGSAPGLTYPRSGYGSILRVLANSMLLLFAVAFLLCSSGCSNQKFLIRRDAPANPLANQLQFGSYRGPQISIRTHGVLRRYALQETHSEDPLACLEEMQLLLEDEAESTLMYSISELAYVLGKRAEEDGDQAHALDMYGVAVSNAYMYLSSHQSLIRRAIRTILSFVVLAICTTGRWKQPCVSSMLRDNSNRASLTS